MFQRGGAPDDTGHCTHRLVPDAALKLHLDLVRLHKLIEGRLSSYPLCEVIPAGDLLAAKHGANPSEILAAYSGWGAVHGNGGAYTRMALTLVDKVLGGTFNQQLPPPSASDGGSKRMRAESGSFSGGENSFASSRRHNSWTASLNSLAAAIVVAPGAGSPASTGAAVAAAAPVPPATSAFTSPATAL